MKHLMLDIETSGLRLDSAIMELALVSSDGTILCNETGIVTPKLYEAHVDPSTMDWHGTHTGLTRLPHEGNGINIFDALCKLRSSLAKYIEENPDTYLWCKSPSFDIAIVNYWMQNFSAQELSLGISYRRILDFRTIEALASTKYNYPRKTVHRAVEDAKDQMAALLFYLKEGNYEHLFAD